ncbi:hypothetical protein FLA_3777 [Filimonas lacunae]|nr:hypothetical protein FLA_3777 [Filimonas lacunae]
MQGFAILHHSCGQHVQNGRSPGNSSTLFYRLLRRRKQSCPGLVQCVTVLMAIRKQAAYSCSKALQHWLSRLHTCSIIQEE